MDIPDSVVGRLFSEARDARRPTLESILEVIESSFGQMQLSVRRVTAGPPTWIWEDEEMAGIGFPRFYILSTSSTEGLDGYPLFTIRQAYSVRFDTWITMSALVVGPDSDAITRSIALAMAHHAGAFAGVKYTAGAIAANRSSPLAGMVAVRRLLEAPAPVITQESAAQAAEETLSDHDSGKMVN